MRDTCRLLNEGYKHAEVEIFTTWEELSGKHRGLLALRIQHVGRIENDVTFTVDLPSQSCDLSVSGTDFDPTTSGARV